MRLTVARWTVEGFLRDRCQFSQASRGRKLVRECPICGYRGRFPGLEHGLRLDSRCPGCGSRERHWLLHLFLTEDGGWKLDGQRVLHFAPERHMLARMQGDPLYVSADLHQPGVSQRINATAIPYPNDAFDVLISHHILEHIPNDRAALREFARMLRPGDYALLSVPQNHSVEHTDEDTAVTEPMLRF